MYCTPRAARFGEVSRRFASPHPPPARSRQVSALPETRHLLNRQTLGLLKDGAVLINTARGALIDNDALLAELRTGRISAGLDVYLETLEDEAVPASALRDLPNVVVTPGIAGPAGALTKRMSLFVAEELERFFAGRPLTKPVTAAMLPSIA